MGSRGLSRGTNRYSQGGQGALQGPWDQMLLGYPREGRATFSPNPHCPQSPMSPHLMPQPVQPRPLLTVSPFCPGEP